MERLPQSRRVNSDEEFVTSERENSPPRDWIDTSSLAAELGLTVSGIFVIRKRLEAEFKDQLVLLKKPGSPRTAAYFSPQFAEAIRKEARREAPKGWIDFESLAQELKSDRASLKYHVKKLKSQFPNQSGSYKTEEDHAHTITFFSSQFADAIRQHVLRTIPEGWLTTKSLADTLNCSFDTVERAVEQYRNTHPEWFKVLKAKNGHNIEHFAPALAAQVEKDLRQRESPPENWSNAAQMAKQFGVSPFTVGQAIKKLRKDNSPSIKEFKSKAGWLTEYYPPEFKQLVEKEVSEHPIAPKEWQTANALAGKFDRSVMKVRAELDQWRNEYPDWYKTFRSPENGKTYEYYAPELMKLLEKKLGGSELPPQGWENVGGFSKRLNLVPSTVYKAVEIFRQEHPEWFREYMHPTRARLVEYLHPQLIAKLEEQFADEKGDEEKIAHLEQKSETFFKEIGEEQTLEAKEFKKLLTLFGSARAFDILYKYRPEFSSLPAEHVKGEMAKYLGNFLILRNNFKIEDLEVSVPYLSDQSFKDSLSEIVKESCLAYYHKKKLEHSLLSDKELISEYIRSIRDETRRLESAELAEVVNGIENYYSSLLTDFEKPNRVIDSLKEGRTFPDLNQILNIKEISDKKKMLIGDEMGMGKSASAILSKEYLGSKLAVVVVPSNVIDTWKGYLSDQYDQEKRKQIGYFKQGEAPKVLIVEDLSSIPDTAEEYEYVLISQERMNKRYLEKLQALEYDMLIIDEVHKLKNLEEGQRAKRVLELAERIQGDDKYLVLLSGTPVPNKIKDVAMVLKMLYPEKFKDFENEELTNSIINGDLVDLRNLLVPRMQMKTLRESIEMPNLIERELVTELTPNEREIYEVLLEDDELTASEKIRAFRKFTMNPAALEITPGIEGSKIRDVGRQLHAAFEIKKKVVLFVNSYVDGIIRGENNILEKFKLPHDVAVRIIDGSVPRENTATRIKGAEQGRKEIQEEFAKSPQKILLVVSGQTADVGVDFSPAEELVMYNEPWTEFDKRQQIARTYRPGLAHDLEVATSVVRGTIEEGIQEYVRLKFDAVQKLLKGVPITEIEKTLLKSAEKQDGPDIEGDTVIAKEWLNSPQNRLHRFFAVTKEIGEKNFHKFLIEHGEEYAECYLDIGGRGFQANTGRAVGALLNRFIEDRKQDINQLRILDVASGPEVLKSHVKDELAPRMVSMDINPLHFQKEGENSVAGSFVNLPFKEKTVDYANLSLAIHYSRFVPSRGEYERLRVLSEMNRVLKKEGRGIINLIYSLEFKNQEKFRIVAEIAGFKVHEKFTGDLSQGDAYKSHCIVLEKIADTPEFETLIAKIGTENFDGLKFKETGVTSLRNGRRIISSFEVNGEQIPIALNAKDKKLSAEEQSILTEGNALRETYGSIKAIPKEEIVRRGFLKIFNGKNYRLLKKSELIGGFVEIR